MEETNHLNCPYCAKPIPEETSLSPHFIKCGECNETFKVKALMFTPSIILLEGIVAAFGISYEAELGEFRTFFIFFMLGYFARWTRIFTGHIELVKKDAPLFFHIARKDVKRITVSVVLLVFTVFFGSSGLMINKITKQYQISHKEIVDCFMGSDAPVCTQELVKRLPAAEPLK
ncbi:MAG: hypothetical protein JNM93_04675 [Bacteriovoracaceae bacterium]|nr:hypothetical protein [Bacteriovoracaceae bacterium]